MAGRSRTRVLGRGAGRAPRAVVAALSCAALAVSTLTAGASPAAASSAAARSQRPAVPATPILPRGTVPVGRSGPRPSVAAAGTPADSTWPAAASATAELSAAPAGAAGTASATAGRETPGSWALVNHRAGSTPISVRDTEAATSSATTPAAAVAVAAQSVAVSVTPHSAAEAAGVDGVLFSLTPSSAASPLQVSVDYSAFSHAVGGDYGSRLRLVELPACVLTTPQSDACRIQTPLDSDNDGAQQTVRATVTDHTAAAQTAPAGAPGRFSPAQLPAPAVMVLGVEAGPSGPQGDFTVSSLGPTGSWSAGGSTGAFTYTYPVTVPPVAAGNAAPKVTLSYDSSAVDGMTAATNSQSSWVGAGWAYDPGYIERTYIPCSQETPALPAADLTGDECWDGQILTLSLNGQTQAIVPDSSGGFHLQDDDGAVITRLTNTGSGANGAQNGEYWRVTETNGMVYTFGVNEAPGFTSADKPTDSVYTEPVYGTSSGQPCYNSAGFSQSSCTQAWRWNLDMVQDANGNTAMYYYAPETNYYTPDYVFASPPATPATQVKYVRGGTLTEIDYGMRDEGGDAYTVLNGTDAPERILFATASRCFGSACSFNSADAGNWYDTPEDESCGSTGTCTNYSPTFWSTQRLTTITTEVYNSSTSAYQDVDKYALSQNIDTASGDDDLVLYGITRTGYDSSGANPLGQPEETYEYQAYPNQVGGYGGNSPLDHDRMYEVTADTGQAIIVTYNNTQCTESGLPPYTDTIAQQESFASKNTLDCYPVIYEAYGKTATLSDYFYVYSVQSVSVEDPNALSVPQVTSYIYGGGTAAVPGAAAWHYDDNQVVKPSNRTYGQFRGYTTVETLTGDPQNENPYTGAEDQQTETLAKYFQGMNGDTLPGGGTSSVDLAGTSISDNEAYDGLTYETQTYNGAGGAEVSSTVTVPETVATTATEDVSGLPALTADIVKAQSVTTTTDLASGGTAVKRSAYSYDSLGRVTAEDDSGTGVADTCTTTAYASGSTAGVLDAPDQVTTAAQSCPSPVGTALTAADITKDTKTYYDGSSTLGSVAAGNTTRTDTASQNNSGTLVWISDDTQAAYDSSGRQLSATDARGLKTSTTYTPADGGPLTQKAVGNAFCAAGVTASCATTTTTYDPGRGVVTKYVDGAGHTTSATYDSLGRMTAEWTPGFTQGTSDATTTYTYLLQDKGPEAVTTDTLVDDGASSDNLNYKTSISLYNAMGQLIQTQAAGENGTTVVNGTYYDSHGWAVETDNRYAVAGAPSTAPVSTPVADVDSRTQTAYDGDDRPVMVTQYDGLTATSAVQTVYGGDRTTTIGLTGAGAYDPGVTAQTAITDVRGNEVELDQYTGQPTVSGNVVSAPAAGTIPGVPAVVSTSYTFDTSGDQTKVVDSSGDVWTKGYDLLGHALTSTDPDTGTTTAAYDPDGNVSSTTDADKNVLSYAYDDLNRKIGEYDSLTQSSSTELDSWLYDTEQKGQLTSSTSFGPQGAYVDKVAGYNVQGLPGGSVITVPAGETGLGGSYLTQLAYTTTGLVSQIVPAPVPGSGLPGETVSIGYDALGDAVSEGGSNVLVSGVTYTPYEEQAQVTLGASNAPVWETYTYNQQTRQVTSAETSDQSAAPQLDDLVYTLNAAQQITRVTDTQGDGSSAPVEEQCYGYDALQQLTEAWTDSSAGDDCATKPDSAGNGAVGGPEPYWTSWTFDPQGNRTSQTQYALSGQTGGNTVSDYAYTYNTSTQTTEHALTGITTTGPGASTLTGYTYDPAGNTTAYATPAGTQTMTWNAEGQLLTDTTPGAGGGQSSYLYDASGNLLVRRDPQAATTTDTLYLPGEEMDYNTSTKAVTATRYYTFSGQTVAERTGSGVVDYLISDQHGTNQLAINANTMALTRRELDPYGNPVGAVIGASSWVDQHGFLGKPADAATGLTTIGARTYDPSSGRFISCDPVREFNDPQELSGYAYSADDPTNDTDPTGLRLVGPDGGDVPYSDYHYVPPPPPPPYVSYYSTTVQGCGGSDFALLCVGVNYTVTHDGSAYCGPLIGFSPLSPEPSIGISQANGYVGGSYLGKRYSDSYIDGFVSGGSVSVGGCYDYECMTGVWGNIGGYSPDDFGVEMGLNKSKNFGEAGSLSIEGAYSYAYSCSLLTRPNWSNAIDSSVGPKFGSSPTDALKPIGALALTGLGYAWDVMKLQQQFYVTQATGHVTDSELSNPAFSAAAAVGSAAVSTYNAVTQPFSSAVHSVENFADDPAGFFGF